MSTDSLVSSAARTSTSDDFLTNVNGGLGGAGREVGVVELEVARETWRNTPSSALRPGSPFTTPTSPTPTRTDLPVLALPSVTSTASQTRQPNTPTRHTKATANGNGVSLKQYDDGGTRINDGKGLAVRARTRAHDSITTRQPMGVAPMSIPSNNSAQ